MIMRPDGAMGAAIAPDGQNTGNALRRRDPPQTS